MQETPQAQERSVGPSLARFTLFHHHKPRLGHRRSPLPFIRFALLRTGQDNTLRNSLHAGDTPSPGEVCWSFPRSFHTISSPQASPWPQKEPLPLIRHTTSLQNTLHNSQETAAPTAWTQPELPRTFITKL